MEKGSHETRQGLPKTIPRKTSFPGPFPPEDRVPVATAKQGQMVRLHGVVAEGHVRHEVAEVSCLHQPLPSCRRRRVRPGHRTWLRGDPASGRGAEGRILGGVKERVCHVRVASPRTALPPPTSILGFGHYMSILFGQSTSLIPVPPDVFVVRDFLSIVVLPEGDKRADACPWAER